jgi:signal transduction histidine kinase
MMLLGELAASVAHEIKSPLCAVKMFTTLLKEKNKSQDQMLFAALEGAVEHLNHISNKILDYSRQTPTQVTLCQLEDILEQAYQLTRHEVSKHDLVIEKRFDPLVQINGNSGELIQVFTNLMINACHASLPGQKIKWLSKLNDPFIEITIQDEGTGIAPQVLPHIFESFYSTKGEKGNGLGLAISKEIIERHGGKIEVESIFGLGTTFKVLLPTR